MPTLARAVSLPVVESRLTEPAPALSPAEVAGGDPMHSSAPLAGMSPDAAAPVLTEWAVNRFAGQRMVITTAFGMEGCALIDMVARAGAAMEIIYLDTHFFFEETHRLREKLAERYPKLHFVNRGTSLTPEQQEAQHGEALWRDNPDLCCHLRKVEPMRQAMMGVDVWFTGLRRSQSPTRANLQVLEWDWKFGVLKFSPMASWSRTDVWEYIQEHDIPYNELHDREYPTVGCTHCTMPVPGSRPDSYSRDGRWAGTNKTECGLHGAADKIEAANRDRGAGRADVDVRPGGGGI
ncbi:MAG: phosphoadenylyl-sulfate reductase [Planctomycetota bacterium]